MTVEDTWLYLSGLEVYTGVPDKTKNLRIQPKPTIHEEQHLFVYEQNKFINLWSGMVLDVVNSQDVEG